MRLARGMLVLGSMNLLLHAISRKSQEEPVSDAVNPEPPDSSKGAKTVVLAEDEPVVREFMASVLREAGYNVLPAENGEQALRIFERFRGRKRRIDLLLTDIVMPVLGGKALAHKVGALFPETKIVFCSAYPEKVGVSNGMFDKQIPFLQKPTSIDALKSKVQEVLSDAEEDLKQERLPESPSDGEAETKSTILVIDDDPAVLLTVKTLLVKRGFNVLSTPSSPKGLDMLRYAGGDIRIVVLDYSMPKLNGDETLKFIKQLNPNAKVIGLTAMKLDSLPKAYLDGVHKLLTKPVIATALIGAIDELLGDGPTASSAIRLQAH
jgi:CheY-like chemotaxis protein